ncbi:MULTISPECIES: alpha/beta fold hydrolase [Pseudomonadaceae]|uniref:alpha/beta fold hydrolase n=1 Tax=Pseudomonadaceae TaxID=135621 RepID=UPI00103F95D8|nr:MULTISPECIES: alpha/beta hydrolase [Pseudomonadaceae]MBA1279580.1 alpha/beta hydrolase [Stutzerimonas stutzeri]TCD19084.1 alpha/beta hydrolase [Pseudomonas sp. IC_126]
MNVSTEDRYLPTEHGEVFTRHWRTSHSRKTPIVLLHDSLGCVELWRDFPERLAAATARDVIAYDRLGFGRSAPHPGGWSNRFIRDEAELFFPPVRQALDIEHFILFGHSVGGAMAASIAARYPHQCRALITESAQAFVEARTLEGIRQAQAAFAEPGQMERLSKYHGDKAAWVLSAWIDTWLSETYADWTLEETAPSIACPLLAIHGLEDEYGSETHPQRIVELGRAPVQKLLLDNCHHVPHREQPEVVVEAVVRFLQAAWQPASAASASAPGCI